MSAKACKHSRTDFLPPAPVFQQLVQSCRNSLSRSSFSHSAHAQHRFAHQRVGEPHSLHRRGRPPSPTILPSDFTRAGRKNAYLWRSPAARTRSRRPEHEYVWLTIASSQRGGPEKRAAPLGKEAVVHPLYAKTQLNFAENVPLIRFPGPCNKSKPLFLFYLFEASNLSSTPSASSSETRNSAHA
jgi:hypothetical protein